MRKTFYENYIGASKAQEAGKTYEQERLDAEKAAVDFDMKRKAQAENYPKIEVSSESHPGTTTEFNDQEGIVEKAAKHLKAEIGRMVGRGGFTIDVDEFRALKAHADKVDSTKHTDTALVSFDVNFTLPGVKSYKLARFAVSFDGNRDKPYKVEERFLDANDKNYTLTAETLKDFLMEKEMRSAKKSDKPVVWFNPETGDTGTFEAMKTVVASDKIIGRLAGEGFEVDSNFYVDACYDPNTFGRVCHLVAVPMDRTADFKKICGFTDEEWINRGSEKLYKQPKTDWVDRALEKNTDMSLSTPGMDYNKPNYKNPDEWVARTENKDSKENPYGKGAGMMKDDALHPDLRKEAVKKALAEKVPETLSTLDKLNKLDELLK